MARVRASVAAARATSGQIDILVNSAGMKAPVETYPTAEFQRLLDINLSGPSTAIARVPPPHEAAPPWAHPQ